LSAVSLSQSLPQPPQQSWIAQQIRSLLGRLAKRATDQWPDNQENLTAQEAKGGGHLKQGQG
jgi:hypothetical protein